MPNRRENRVLRLCGQDGRLVNVHAARWRVMTGGVSVGAAVRQTKVISQSLRLPAVVLNQMVGVVSKVAVVVGKLAAVDAALKVFHAPH